MPGRLPTLEPQVAFGSDPTAASQIWTPLAFNDLLEFSVKRGRADERSETETGLMDWILKNQDRRFDPTFQGVLSNYVGNPSVETNLNGWAGYSDGGTPTLTRFVDGNGGWDAGGYRLRAQMPAGTGRLFAYGHPNTTPQMWVPVTAGQTLGARAKARVTVGPATQLFIEVIWWSDPETYVNEVFTTGIVGPLVGAVYDLAEKVTVPSGCTKASMGVAVFGASAATVLDIDAAFLTPLADASSPIPPYIDGDQDNGRWAGTPHASQTYFGGPYYPNVKPVKQARLRVWDPSNLVPNASFENGVLSPWQLVVGSGVTVDWAPSDLVHPTTGGYRAYSNPASASDIAISSDFIPIDPLSPYTLSAYFRKWAGTSPVSNTALYLDLYDKNFYWIGALWGNTPPGGGGVTHVYGNFTPGGGFARYGGTFLPGWIPKDVRYARVTIWLQSSLAGLTNGTVVDGVQLVQGESVIPLDDRQTYIKASYDIFRGDTEDWPQDWEARENQVHLSVVDAFEALGTADVSMDTPPQMSGDRINAILDAAGWPSADRLVDTPGQSLLSAMSDATDGQFSNALSLLREVAASENANIFIDGQGRFVFHDRHHRFKSPYSASQVTFNNIPTGIELPYTDTRPRQRKQDIINLATVSISGGATFSAEDTASKTQYRRRTKSVTVILSNPNEAQSLAQFLVQTYKDPVTSWEYLVLEPQLDDALWQHALGREIGDRVTIKATPPGGGVATNREAVIEKIEHKMVRGRWTTIWRLGRGDIKGFWVLGVSLLGTDTKLAY